MDLLYNDIVIGAWLSLVEYQTGGLMVAGSNPVAPTIGCPRRTESVEIGMISALFFVKKHRFFYFLPDQLIGFLYNMR